MIACPVCGAQNDDLAVTCSACRSYLQTKVDNLDLFETIWTLIETPKAAMKRIALARHKNYVVLLSALFGIGLAFSLLWYWNLGPRFPDLLTLVGTGLIAGPFLGLAFLALSSLMQARLSKMIGGRGRWRVSFATLGYSAVPLVLSLVFVFPIEIAVFGLYFFDRNPPPIVINPAAYVVLIGLDVLALGWSLALLFVGLRVAEGIGPGKAALLMLPPVLLAAGLAEALVLL